MYAKIRQKQTNKQKTYLSCDTSLSFSASFITTGRQWLRNWWFPRSRLWGGITKPDRELVAGECQRKENTASKEPGTLWLSSPRAWVSLLSLTAMPEKRNTSSSLRLSGCGFLCDLFLLLAFDEQNALCTRNKTMSQMLLRILPPPFL